MYGNHYTGIISKEMYEAVQMEMAARSNVEKTEEGTRRKNTKYSSKKKKTAGGRSSIKLDKNPIDVADGMCRNVTDSTAERSSVLLSEQGV